MARNCWENEPQVSEEPHTARHSNITAVLASEDIGKRSYKTLPVLAGWDSTAKPVAGFSGANLCAARYRSTLVCCQEKIVIENLV